MRRYVIGTAGHVDHGKTALVRALTGVDTDRLSEEKRRGISIELGFAPFRFDHETQGSIIDVPGHARLVHTMIAGATGIELVLLVVAADEGVMPQTREHIDVCALLGIRRVVVAVTKVDRVDSDLVAMAEAEATDAVRDRFEGAFVRCSSRTGEGIDALKKTLSRALQSLEPAPLHEDAPSIFVDRVFSIRGAGTVVTGTLRSGEMSVGAPVWIYRASGTTSSCVRGLQVHGADVARIAGPARVAANLAAISVNDVSRGDLLSLAGDVPVTSTIDVLLDAIIPIATGASVQMHVGTTQTPARFRLIELIGANKLLGRLRLAVAKPLRGGERFVLRGSGRATGLGAVVAGGTVLDAVPPPRLRLESRKPVLRALRMHDADAVLRAAVQERGSRPLSEESLSHRFSLSHRVLERAADRLLAERVLLKTADGYASSAALMSLARQVRTIVKDHHRRSPYERGIGVETVRRTLAAQAGEAVGRLAIQRAVELFDVVVEAGVLRIPAMVDSIEKEHSEHYRTVRHALARAGTHGRSEAYLAEETALDRRETRAILSALGTRKLAVRAGDLWFDAVVVESTREIVSTLEQPFEVRAFKERTGLPRKQAILLLEYFDAEGLTRRFGAARYAIRTAPPHRDAGSG